jgi:DNA-nicking Smr family endonuclease
MTRRARRLSREEAALWAQVARTVAPLDGKDPPQACLGEGDRREAVVEGKSTPPSAASRLPPPRDKLREDRKADLRPLDRHGLDGSWEKRLARGLVQPDFTLDLHGHSLDAAHARLDQGLSQAIAMGARAVLVITGRPRPVDAADRGSRRGAIRAKLVDWLAHGSHASRIAAVRPAHRRHGGAGAVYVVLRRPR